MPPSAPSQSADASARLTQSSIANSLRQRLCELTQRSRAAATGAFNQNKATEVKSVTNRPTTISAVVRYN